MEVYFRLWGWKGGVRYLQGMGKRCFRLLLHPSASFTCLTPAGGSPPIHRDSQGHQTIHLNFLTWNDPQTELILPGWPWAAVHTCQAFTLLSPGVPIPPGVPSALHTPPPPCHCQASICCLDALNLYSHPGRVPASPIPKPNHSGH